MSLSGRPTRLSVVIAVLRHAAGRLRWWHVPLGVALGTWTLVYMGAPTQPGATLAALDAPWVYNVLQFGLPLVLALVVADAAVAHGARPIRTYGSAALAVVLGGVFVIGPALMPWLGSAPGWEFLNDFWLASGVGVLVGLIVAGYAMARQAALRLQQARAAEAERQQRAQALQGEKLAALQARVDPALLFDALGRVAACIDTDVAGADARLADIITLLRALLPSTAAGGGSALTSLGRELELVRLQARLADDAAFAPDRLPLTMAPEAAAAAVAPTIVPQWLRLLVPTGTDWTLHADVVGGQAQLRLRHIGSARRPAPELAALAARLTEAHGNAAGMIEVADGFELHWPLSEP